MVHARDRPFRRNTLASGSALKSTRRGRVMLETFCLSVLGSGGVAGIFFALIRHYIERRLMEVEAREQERIKYKIEQRKADEEITHATGRVLFWLHHAIVKGEHNGELEEAFENLQRAEAHKKEMDREVLAKYSID